MDEQITVRLPDDLVARLEAAVERGEFANKSEAVRHGIRLTFEGGD